MTETNQQDELAILRAGLSDLAQLRAEITQLRTDNATLAQQVHQLKTGQTTLSIEPASPALASTSRRRMIKQFAGAAAGLAAAAVVVGSSTQAVEAASPAATPAPLKTNPGSTKLEKRGKKSVRVHQTTKGVAVKRDAPVPNGTADGQPVNIAVENTPSSATSLPTTLRDPSITTLATYPLFYANNASDVELTYDTNYRAGMVGAVSGVDAGTHVRVGTWGIAYGDDVASPALASDQEGYGIIGDSYTSDAGFASAGVLGEGFGSGGNGVVGVADVDFGYAISGYTSGNDGRAIYGFASGDRALGGYFQGTQAAIQLAQSSPDNVYGPPIGLTEFHDVGEIYLDANGAAYYCVKASVVTGQNITASAVWRKLQGYQRATIGSGVGATVENYSSVGAYHVLPQPDRYVDTRSGLGGVTGPVPTGAATSGAINFTATGRPGLGTSATVAGANGRVIPVGAVAITGVLGIISPQITGGVGFATVYPADTAAVAPPTVSNIVFSQNNVPVSTSFTTNLTAAGKFNIYVNRKVQILVDITGYYL